MRQRVLANTLWYSRMKCQVVLKSGPRAGRKCLRVNCSYHQEEKDSVEEVKEVVQVEEKNVEEKVVFSDVEIEHPVVEPVVDSPPPLEPIPVEELYPVVPSIEPKQESPIFILDDSPEVVKQEEKIILELVGPEEQAKSQLPIVVGVEQPPREVIDVDALGEIELPVKEEEFVEVTENDCKERTEVMVIDTETIGLPPHKSIPMTSAEWERCRVVQIAWKLLSSGVMRNYIIRPDDFQVQLTSIHGITQKQAEEEGVPMKEVLSQLVEDLKTVAVVVAHNIDFDHQVVAYELYRAGVSCEWDSDVLKKECTMQLARVAGIVEKPTRLGVLYETCFHKPPVNKLHRADADVEVCAEIYEWLKEKMQYKVYFQVDYKDKDVFKFFGGQWDPEKKKWYTYECHRFFGYLKKWFSR
jgi:DNA polymerase III epsilon subunit-like protein